MRLAPLALLAVVALSLLQALQASLRSVPCEASVVGVAVPSFVPPGTRFGFSFNISLGKGEELEAVSVESLLGVLNVSNVTVTVLESSNGSTAVVSGYASSRWTGSPEIREDYLVLKALVKSGNETEELTKSAEVRVGHYVVFSEAPALPSALLLNHSYAVSMQVFARMSVPSAWIEVAALSSNVVVAAPGSGWSKRVRIDLGPLAGGEARDVTVLVKGIEKGYAKLLVTLWYRCRYGRIRSRDVFLVASVVEKGIAVSVRSVYLTVAAPPLVTVTTNYTLNLYVFSTQGERVWVTAFVRSPAPTVVKVSPPTTVLSVEPGRVAVAHFRITPVRPGSGVVVFEARFARGGEVVREHVSVCVGGAFAFPNGSVGGGRVAVTYAAYGCVKDLRAVLRVVSQRGSVLGFEGMLVNETKIVVPVPLPKGVGAGALAEGSTVIAVPPARPGSRRIYAVSMMWRDSSLGWVESKPVVLEPSKLFVTGFAFNESPSVVDLVVAAFADGRILGAELNVTVLSRGSRVATLVQSVPPSDIEDTGLVTLVRLRLNASRPYLLYVVVGARVEKTVLLPTGYWRAKKLVLVGPALGSAFVGYRITTPLSIPPPPPLGLAALVVLGLALALFLLSLSPLLEPDPLKALARRGAELFLTVLAAVAVLGWGRIYPALVAWLEKLFGAPRGDPLAVLLASAQLFNAVVGAFLKIVIDSVYYAATTLSWALIAAGAVSLLVPPAAQISRVLSFLIAGVLQPACHAMNQALGVLMGQLMPSVVSTLWLANALSRGLVVTLLVLERFGPVLAAVLLALSTLPPLRRFGLFGAVFMVTASALVPAVMAPLSAGLASMVGSAIAKLLPILRGVAASMGSIAALLSTALTRAVMGQVSGELLAAKIRALVLSAAPGAVLGIFGGVVSYLVAMAVAVAASLIASYLIASAIASGIELGFGALVERVESLARRLFFRFIPR